MAAALPSPSDLLAEYRAGFISELAMKTRMLQGRDYDPKHDPRDMFLEACRAGDKDALMNTWLCEWKGGAVEWDLCEFGVWIAAANGQLDIVKFFLQCGGASGVAPLAEHAVTKGVQKGFEGACGNGHLDVVKYMLTLTGERTVQIHTESATSLPATGPFASACRKGHLAVVAHLLSLNGDRRVDINACGEKAFEAACSGGHIDVVALLLSLTGDQFVNVTNGADLGSAVPLTVAVMNDHTDIVALLLSLQGDRMMTLGPDGGSAFRFACKRGNKDIIDMFLNLNGERRITEVDPVGVECVKVMLDAGRLK
jgi:hypothetical protein